MITDWGIEFERVFLGYTGKLYAEVSPRTFNIGVRMGTKLNQLRFIRGNPVSSDRLLTNLSKSESLVYMGGSQISKPDICDGLRVSINLHNNRSSRMVGYKAKKDAPIIDLQKIDYYEPREFWEPVYSHKSKSIILNPGDFYILGSREKVRVPPTVAAEMIPFDPTLGEFRIHYAGFLILDLDMGLTMK